MSVRTQEIEELRQATAELTAMEYGWEWWHQVPPAFVEPRLQTYLQQHVQPSELREQREKQEADRTS
jgi:hypothetical protein